MRIPNNIIDTINEAKNIAIFTHIRPDADAIGSSCALKLAFESIDKTVDIYCDGEITINYQFIKASNTFNNPQILTPYDLVIAVDCCDLGRLGRYVEQFGRCTNSINLDHHYASEKYAKFNLIIDCCSTGEIIFNLLNKMKINITRDIATCLYSAIASDTGCFMHSNTTSAAHFIASRLLKKDIDVNKANFFLFKRKTYGQIQLNKTALHNLRFYLDKKVAIMYLTIKDFEHCYTSNNESFGLVDTCVNIENVEIGILISEVKPNLFACSFRGKGNIDVSKIAEEFGGGGHKNASGCNIFGSYNTAINKIVKVCKKYI